MLRSPITAAVALSLALGCGSEKKQEPAAEAPKDAAPVKAVEEKPPALDAAVAVTPPDAGVQTKGQHGFAIASGVLWGIEPPPKTGRKKLKSTGAVAWCQTDIVGQVVWYHGQGGLHAYDTRDGSVHHVMRHPKEGPIAAVEIDYGPSRPGLRSATAADTDVAVRVTVSKEPMISAVVVCEAEGLEYCYSEMTGEDPSGWVLTEDAAAAKAVAEKAQLRDKAFIVELAGRMTSFKLPPLAPTPAEPEVTIDAARCEAKPEVCGQVEYLGGRFWVVTTGVEAGEEGQAPRILRQLYDAKTREYVNPDGWLRRKWPHDKLPDLRVRVSQDGKFALIDGSLVNLATGKYSWGRGDVIECGFLQ